MRNVSVDNYWHQHTRCRASKPENCVQNPVTISSGMLSNNHWITSTFTLKSNTAHLRTRAMTSANASVRTARHHISTPIVGCEVNTATCKSYRDRGSETDGNITFNLSETRKRTKYDNLAASETWSFIRFIWIFGGLWSNHIGFHIPCADKAVDITGGGLLERSQIWLSRCTIANRCDGMHIIHHAILLAANKHSSAQVVVRPDVGEWNFPAPYSLTITIVLYPTIALTDSSVFVSFINAVHSLIRPPSCLLFLNGKMIGI